MEERIGLVEGLAADQTFLGQPQYGSRSVGPTQACQ